MTEVTSEIVMKTVMEHTGLERDKIKPESRFFEDLELDSLDMVELTMAFEDDNNVEISDEETEATKTVQDAIDLLSAKLGVPA